mmetsp:Transcript_1152/g.3354  ORF Transcript_1152/g.3354 Transcript_1152/m.3354 type:complete len:82 (-) Transcript_1152:290-535(-)
MVSCRKDDGRFPAEIDRVTEASSIEQVDVLAVAVDFDVDSWLVAFMVGLIPSDMVAILSVALVYYDAGGEDVDVGKLMVLF